VRQIAHSPPRWLRLPASATSGTGEIDYPNIYRKLAQLDYDKFLAMEFYPTADPIATLRKARLDVQAAMSAAGR
jgi:hydroxypyruvate isomerase